jgi:hypothetical protein
VQSHGLGVLRGEPLERDSEQEQAERDLRGVLARLKKPALPE